MDDITLSNAQPNQSLATPPIADATASSPPVADQPATPLDTTATPTQDTFTPTSTPAPSIPSTPAPEPPESIVNPSQPEPVQPTSATTEPVKVGGEDLPNTDILEKDIFELMGVDDLPEDKKNELFGKMMETIEKRVFARVHETLEDADLPKFKELLESDNPDELKAFIAEKGIDLNELMSQEAFVYKAGMAQLAKPLKDAREQAKNESPSAPKPLDTPPAPVVTPADVASPPISNQVSPSQNLDLLNNQSTLVNE